MNPKTKKAERIALCGKRVNLVRGKNGIRKCQILFCGYYNDCAKCNERQIYKRKSAIERVIYSYHDDLFREIIERDEWENLRHKLNYHQSEYIRVPQDNNKYLIVSSENIDGNFTAVSHTDVINELTSKENLFAPGRRSTSRNWKLKQDKKEYSETFDDEKYLLEINAIDPHDYVSDYVKSTKEDKLKEELGLAYDLFYPQHQYDEVEQAEIDKVVVY